VRDRSTGQGLVRPVPGSRQHDGGPRGGGARGVGPRPGGRRRSGGVLAGTAAVPSDDREPRPHGEG